MLTMDQVHDIRERYYEKGEKYQLTNREIEIIGYIYKGYKNDDIARDLAIAPNTVKKHVYNIFYKLDVSNRVQMVNFIFKNRLQDFWEN